MGELAAAGFTQPEVEAMELPYGRALLRAVHEREAREREFFVSLLRSAFGSSS